MASPALKWGRVVAIHPEDYSVDLVMTDDGSQLAGVQVLTPFASTSSGFACLIEPSTSANGNKWDLTETKPTDVLAGVAYFGQYPIVIGFRYPQICQMLFKDLQRAINRHPSDFYTSTDGEGNFEAYHPSGTYFRIGSSPAHEDLTGKDVDGKWTITKNTASAPYVHLTVANAGTPVASFDIDPEGNVTAENNGNLSATVGGELTANVTGPATVSAPAGTTWNGPFTLNGLFTYTQGMVGSGGEGSAAAISGNVTVSGGDVKADTISLKEHLTAGVTAGSDKSQAPVAS